jgi:hypothetical protein
MRFALGAKRIPNLHRQGQRPKTNFFCFCPCGENAGGDSQLARGCGTLLIK